MKAIRIHDYGTAETLVYEDAPIPQLGQDEILVRIHAAGVNPVDWMVRAGLVRTMLHHTFPLIVGWDMSGVVEEVSPGVSEIRPGDEVYARSDFARNGTYAEYAVVSRYAVAKKPRSLDHACTAALPLVGLTAWQALIEPGGIELAAGQTLLIHGAAGGVGSMAVQLAKWRGAKVIATGSSRNQDFLSELGADIVVDYTARRFEDVVGEVDAVLDTVGGEAQSRSWTAIRRGGALATLNLGSQLPNEAMLARGIRGTIVQTQMSGLQLKRLADLVDGGAIRPIVSEVLPLAQTRKAHALSETGHVRGKIVLEVRTA